jgi:hypothetical protein
MVTNKIEFILFFTCHSLYPSTKRTTGLPVGELVLWCGMFAPKGRLEWYHGLARGAPLDPLITAVDTY